MLVGVQLSVLGIKPYPCNVLREVVGEDRLGMQSKERRLSSRRGDCKSPFLDSNATLLTDTASREVHTSNDVHLHIEQAANPVLSQLGIPKRLCG